MTFEQQIARLEAIVAQLNDSKLDLAKLAVWAFAPE